MPNFWLQSINYIFYPLSLRYQFTHLILHNSPNSYYSVNFTRHTSFFQVTFLDVDVCLDNGHLHTSIFIKSTSLCTKISPFLQLPHPSIKCSIPFSLAIWECYISSHHNDLLTCTSPNSSTLPPLHCYQTNIHTQVFPIQPQFQLQLPTLILAYQNSNAS